jgi:hypothetical protein
MRLLLSLTIILLLGCSSTPVKEPEIAGKYKNACLPEAIMMRNALKKSGVEARVLAIYTPKLGHAICVYLYPPGKNQLWGWDSYWKSLRLRAYTDDPEGVAKAWLRWASPTDTLTRAEYIE